MARALPARSYSRMNPCADRATTLTPCRSASDSYACAAAYDIHGYILTVLPTRTRFSFPRPCRLSRAWGNVSSAHAFVRDTRAMCAPVHLVLGTVQPTQESFSVLKCLRQWVTMHVLSKVRPANGATDYSR
jgi:hypothetical protein